MSGVVDLVLVLVLLAYAVAGFRQGFVASLFSLSGFFVGALLGVQFLPGILSKWSVMDDESVRAVTLIGGVMICGWALQHVGSLVGARLRAGLDQTAEPLRIADAVGGALLVTAAASLIIWFFGGVVRTAGGPEVAKAVGDSKVVTAIDSLVPEGTGDIFAGVRSFLAREGFPQVFGGIGAEPITPVTAPDPEVANLPGVARGANSVLKITTTSNSCNRNQEGTGWVVSPGRVVTNAHVVAGSSAIRVETPQGWAGRGQVVVFDPDRDLAVIDVPGLESAPLTIGTELSRQDSAVVPGYPLDGPYTVVAARVRNVLDARGRDIYGKDRVVREIYSLNTTVHPGNSGGPLLDPDGKVVGVIFARSLEDPQTGYALTLDEAEPVLARATSARAPVPTGACITE